MTKVFMWSNVVLCFFIFIWMIMGVNFTGLDILSFKNDSLKWIFVSLGAFVIMFWLIGCALSIFGFKMSRQERIGKVFPCVYGFFIFFLVMLPLFSQASFISEISQLDQQDIDHICTPNWKFHDPITDISDKFEWLKGLNSDIHNGMAKMAIKFDSQTLIMNEYMCSEVCPCANPTTTNIHGETSSPAAAWNALDEAKLNVYGRTRSSKNGYRNLVFESDPNGVAYDSF